MCSKRVKLLSGKFGNTLDGKGARKLFKASDKSDDEDDDEDDGGQRRGLLRQRKEEEADLPCHSTTQPMMMHMMIDKIYGYLPINRDKPCLYVVGNFEDFRKRLLHSNLIGSIADKLVSQSVSQAMNRVLYTFFFRSELRDAVRQT